MPEQIGDLTIYSVAELAQRLKVSNQTIRRYIKTGRLKSKKVGQKYIITEEAVIALLTEPEEPTPKGRK